MGSTIDMQTMRYLNLFSNISRVQTRYCFPYNDAIVYCVPKEMVSKAVGENGKNVKRLSEILNKKIKVLATPISEGDIEVFIHNLVSPVAFKGVEVTDEEVILSAGRISKASLIGRGKKRFLEMQRILRDFFDKELKIV